MHANNDLPRALSISVHSPSCSPMHGRCLDGLFDRFNLHPDYELPPGGWRILWGRVYFRAYFNPAIPVHNGRRLSDGLDLYPHYGLFHTSCVWRPLHCYSNKLAEYSLHLGCIQCVPHRPDLYTNGDVLWALPRHTGADLDAKVLLR
ncbi:hypothetical protein PENSUB_6122 [Penicillium subrubescens]|uniref:Uncharacterized protein n=1 Tax=Penicillium subrubescens TaxID=1316194 RepID=A0A1Q5U383_9EURO|nr:hypothetical protein PENSUB_6122 [Penicillium subrubescens]